MTLTSLHPALVRAFMNEHHRRSLAGFHGLVFEIINGFPLKPAPYLETVAHQLERMLRGENRRLIITMPPRHGKSELASNSYVAWTLGHAPWAKFMLCSYGLELSRENLRKVRQIMEDPRYQAIFPQARLAKRERRRNVFVTTAGGEVRAVSTGGAVTGFGTHILVIDDLHKADDALTPVGREAAIRFYLNSLLSRFNDPVNGRIVVVGQRLHEEDIVGHLLGSASDWYHLNLPAVAERDEIYPLPGGRPWLRRRGDVLHPDHMPLSELMARQRALGRFYNAQYQQIPCVGDGSLIRLSWFGQYEETFERTFFHRIVQTWDPAITARPKSDFSVGMTWGFRGGRWYLLDLIRERLEFPELKARVVAWHRRWEADALSIEGVSIGHSLWQELRRENLPGMLLCLHQQRSRQA